MQKTNILLALAGAAVLMASSPALAQAPAAPAAEAPAAAAPAADAAATAAPAAEVAASEDPTTVAEAAGGGHGEGGLTPISMFMEATLIVQVVMVGLLLASIFSWTLLIIKLIEFAGVNGKTDRFLENFRQARTIADMRKVATSDEYDGNPLADMAAAATEEVELARQSGLQVSGEHRETTIGRAQTAVAAVQSGIAESTLRMAIGRTKGKEQCPCCGQVVREGFEINRDVLKDGAA